MNLRPSALAAWSSPCVLAAALCTVLPAHALYKVVGPDGKVTYTDQPAVSPNNKIKPMGGESSGGSGSSAAGLPFELREIVQRFPVVLYTTSSCAPCDAARDMLRQRGVPFSERTVSNAKDGAALSRLTGSSTLPAASVGSQVLQGFQQSEWSSYLDAAGYPATSKLPANFQQAQAEPLTERQATPAPARPAPAPAAAVDAIPPPPSPSGIRF